MAPAHRRGCLQWPAWQWKGAPFRSYRASTSEVICLTGNAQYRLHGLLCFPSAQLLRGGGPMESMQTTRRTGSILGVAALLGCLSLAQPVGARDGRAGGPRDSVVPIVVINASPSQPDAGRVERPERPEDRAVSAPNSGAPSSDIALGSPAGAWAPFDDVPLAAWFLLVTCFLCAGLGPHALRKFQDDAQDAATSQPHPARKPHRTSLT
jgi:hypothetical protein